jgi:hypothetical protein
VERVSFIMAERAKHFWHIPVNVILDQQMISFSKITNTNMMSPGN